MSLRKRDHHSAYDARILNTNTCDYAAAHLHSSHLIILSCTHTHPIPKIHTLTPPPIPKLLLPREPAPNHLRSFLTHSSSAVSSSPLRTQSPTAYFSDACAARSLRRALPGGRPCGSTSASAAAPPRRCSSGLGATPLLPMARCSSDSAAALR